MWVRFIRAGFALGILGLLMYILAYVTGELLPAATSGPHADHQTVSQGAQLFQALTVQNLTLLAGIAVGLFLLWGATVETRGP